MDLVTGLDRRLARRRRLRPKNFATTPAGPVNVVVTGAVGGIGAAVVAALMARPQVRVLATDLFRLGSTSWLPSTAPMLVSSWSGPPM